MKHFTVLTLTAFVTLQVIAVPVPLPYVDNSYEIETSEEYSLGLYPKLSENEQTGEYNHSKLQKPSPSTPATLVVSQVNTTSNPEVINHHVKCGYLTADLHKRQFQQHVSQTQSKFKQVDMNLQQLHTMVDNMDKNTRAVIKETRNDLTETNSRIYKYVNKGTEDLITIVTNLNQLKNAVDKNAASIARIEDEQIKRVELSANDQVVYVVNTIIRELQKIATNPLLPGKGQDLIPASEGNN